MLRGDDAMHGAPVVEWREARGRPTTVGDRTITPVARSLITRWPGGGFVWSTPTAVLVERGGSAERIPIGNLNGRILRAMRVGAVVLIAAWIAMDRKRRSDV
jgi:hypothetical protein